MYLVKPEQVDELWSDPSPNEHAQRLILAHVEDVSEQTGEDWRSWDENEDRFEPNELKWIADFVVRNLVFIRTDLKVSEPDSVSHLMQVLWLTLDLLNKSTTPTSDLGQAQQSRFIQLKTGLKRLFDQKIINKDQVQKVLDYTKRTVFGHLQLYLACIGAKKQVTRVKRVEIFTEMPQMSEVGDLECECREILENGRAATPEELMAGETAVGDQMEGEEENKEEEEAEDVIDPDDPLYGLEQRMANLDLDEESKAVLRAKLIEASNRIKEGLDKRQQDLDAKLAAMPAGKKR